MRKHRRKKCMWNNHSISQIHGNPLIHLGLQGAASWAAITERRESTASFPLSSNTLLILKERR
jgi:hypothetical protein